MCACFITTPYETATRVLDLYSPRRVKYRESGLYDDVTVREEIRGLDTVLALYYSMCSVLLFQELLLRPSQTGPP